MLLTKICHWRWKYFLCSGQEFILFVVKKYMLLEIETLFVFRPRIYCGFIFDKNLLLEMEVLLVFWPRIYFTYFRQKFVIGDGNPTCVLARKLLYIFWQNMEMEVVLVLWPGVYYTYIVDKLEMEILLVLWPEIYYLYFFDKKI